MVRAALLRAALVASTAAPVGAQVAVGDSLWQRGQIALATAAYQRAIEQDRYSVRANILVARALAWGNNIDSALVLLRNARVRVPDDPDVRYSEALYLSWAKRFDAAVLRYDSLLATHPGLAYVQVARARTLSWAGRLDEARRGYERVLAPPADDRDAVRDAGIGLAQVAAWQGDLLAAAARYESLLADDPGDPRALTGLASVRSWQGRPRAAMALLERALKRDSANAEARDLLAAARASARPRTDIELNWSDDSEGDHNLWGLVAQRLFLSERVSLTSTLGSLQAHDASRHATRSLAELVLSANGDRFRGSVSIGGRALDAGTAGVATRSAFTARATATARLARTASLNVSVARLPFDEIAGLIARSLDLTAVDAGLDLVPRHGMSVGLSAGSLGFSDGNRRLSGIVRASQHWTARPWVGVYARMTTFERKVAGYFSPSRFQIYELQGGWERESARWTASIGGGYGTQQVEPSRPWQDAYHVETRLAHRWRNGNELALTSGLSTSAASSAVGAFQYRTAGVSASLAW